VNKMSHLVNDVMVEMWGVERVCLGKGGASILGPADKVPQDENKTKRTHTAIAYSRVILVKNYVIIPCWILFMIVIVRDMWQFTF